MINNVPIGNSSILESKNFIKVSDLYKFISSDYESCKELEAFVLTKIKEYRVRYYRKELYISKMNFFNVPIDICTILERKDFIKISDLYKAVSSDYESFEQFEAFILTKIKEYRVRHYRMELYIDMIRFFNIPRRDPSILESKNIIRVSDLYKFVSCDYKSYDEFEIFILTKIKEYHVKHYRKELFIHKKYFIKNVPNSKELLIDNNNVPIAGRHILQSKNYMKISELYERISSDYESYEEFEGFILTKIKEYHVKHYREELFIHKKHFINDFPNSKELLIHNNNFYNNVPIAERYILQSKTFMKTSEFYEHISSDYESYKEFEGFILSKIKEYNVRYYKGELFLDITKFFFYPKYALLHLGYNDTRGFKIINKDGYFETITLNGLLLVKSLENKSYIGYKEFSAQKDNTLPAIPSTYFKDTCEFVDYFICYIDSKTIYKKSLKYVKDYLYNLIESTDSKGLRSIVSGRLSVTWRLMNKLDKEVFNYSTSELTMLCNVVSQSTSNLLYLIPILRYIQVHCKECKYNDVPQAYIKPNKPKTEKDIYPPDIVEK